MLEGKTVENVKSFTYLGSFVSQRGGTDEEVCIRIGKARNTFSMLKTVWQNYHIHILTVPETTLIEV